MKNQLYRHFGLALLVGGFALGYLQADPAKALFKLNCATCHGEDGRGQTQVGIALKARNFLTDPFKQGDSVEAIAKTLETGVPGTGMASFGYLKSEDRLALAKYVHQLHKGSASTTSSTSDLEAEETKRVEDTPVVEPATTKKEAPKPEPLKVEENAPSPNSPEKASQAKVNESVEVEKPSDSKAIPPVSKTSVDEVPRIENDNQADAEDPKITLGRQVYKLQGCASCHGEDGQADTPTGMALKARSFVVGDYKQGGIAGIKKTLKEGVPGTAMVAFPQIKGQELESLATFLLALKGNPEIAKDPDPKDASGSGQVSISYAMELMAEHERTALKIKFDKSSKGAAVYAAKCAECHGDNGQGDVSIRMISSAPYYRVKTQPILGHDGDWMKRANFDKLVTEGLPGRLKPGMGTITKEDLDSLYDFFVESKKVVK